MCHAAAPARVADVEETSALEMPDPPAPISLDKLAADLDFTPVAARVAACTAGCGVCESGAASNLGRDPTPCLTRRATRDHQAATSARAAGATELDAGQARLAASAAPRLDGRTDRNHGRGVEPLEAAGRQGDLQRRMKD